MTGIPASRPDNVLSLMIQPSGWRRLKLFGASSAAPHRRRRADVIRLAWHLAALAALVPTTRSVTGVEAAIASTVATLPRIVAPIASVPYDLLAVWAGVVVLLSLVRHHGRLALGLVAAMPLGIALSALVNGPFDLAAEGADLALGAAVAGVPVQLVVSLAVVTIASRELSRPFRTFGHRLAAAAILGAVLVPVASPYRVLAGVLVAGIVTALVRLALGSAVTTVSLADIRAGLHDLGIETDSVVVEAAGQAVAVRPDGSRLSVRVMGRDEWEHQLTTTLWRLAWYRNSGTTFRLTTRQQVEHEAFLLLLAQARGASVTSVVTAGVSQTGDALIATERRGAPLDLLPGGVDDLLVDRVWEALGRLHAAGIAHGALGPEAILVDELGRVELGSFEQAQPITRLSQLHLDRAQLLATLALVVGPERAVAASRSRLTEEDAAPLVAHLQSAAMHAPLRRALDAADVSLTDLRTSAAASAAIELPDLQKIWRVSWGALLRLVVLSAVGYLLISQLADIGLDTIVDAMRDASTAILIVALLLGQVPRVAQAASLQTASPTPVPLSRVTKLQFATTFVNLAMPSTAARAAMSIRFFQRSGATAAGALSAGALDSVFGFIAQVSLLGTFLLFGFGTLGFDGLETGGDRSGLWVGVAVVGGLLALGAAVVAFVPKLREPVVGFLGQLREALNVLRSPGAVVRLLVWNLTAELLFSLTIWTVLQAFGQPVGFIDVVIINEAVALFAGLVPVPGGVGVTEGALTTGFVAVGVPHEIAFSAAFSYRLCTFYLPPIWGYLAFSSLRKERFL